MSSNLEIPKYFVAVWWKMKGCNPLEMKAREEKLHRLRNLSLKLVLLVAVATIVLAAYAARQDWKMENIMPIASGDLGLLILYAIFGAVTENKEEKYGSEYRRFQDHLISLGACLRLNEEDLYALADKFSLAAAARKRLEEMAEYIAAVEKIPGSEAATTVQWLRRSFQSHFTQFQNVWGAIPPAATTGDFFPKK